MPVEASLTTRFQQAIATDSAGRIGLAVSGGGDSIAMLHMAAQSIAPDRLTVLTIDHGLRAEAATEIAHVRQQAQTLGLPHHVATWQWDGKGNLQAAARAGRWDALRDMANRHSLDAIWMGHTQDDQIETFLMRLARGSGVDGLTAMARVGRRDGVLVCRPLLDMLRTELRKWLTAQNIAWCDDPSNEDPRFDRIKARKMSSQLAALGLTPKRVLQTIDHMQAARLTLQAAAAAFAQQHMRQEAGDLVIDAKALELAEADAPRRALTAAMGWVAGQNQRPRFARLMDAAARVRAGHSVTLAGCVIAATPQGGARLMREVAATRAIKGRAPMIWDQRWRIRGPATDDITAQALGKAIALCPDWRASGVPRASLMAAPSVWQNGTLVAAPLAGLSQGWTTQIVADFHSSAFAIED